MLIGRSEYDNSSLKKVAFYCLKSSYFLAYEYIFLKNDLVTPYFYSL